MSDRKDLWEREKNKTVYIPEIDTYDIVYSLPEVKVRPTPEQRMSSYMNQGAKTVLPGIMDHAVSYIPGIGDAWDVFRTGWDLYDKNYSNAALTAGLLLVPNIIEKPIKTVSKAISKSTSKGLKAYKYQVLEPISGNIKEYKGNDFKDIYEYYSSPEIQEKAKQIDKKLDTHYSEAIRDILKAMNNKSDKSGLVKYSDNNYKTSRKYFANNAQGITFPYMEVLDESKDLSEGIEIAIKEGHFPHVPFHEIRHAIEIANIARSVTPEARKTISEEAFQNLLENHHPRLDKLFDGNINDAESTISQLSQYYPIDSRVYEYLSNKDEMNSFLAPMLMTKFKKSGNLHFNNGDEVIEAFQNAFTGNIGFDYQNLSISTLIKNANKFADRWKEYGLGLTGLYLGNKYINKNKENIKE